MKKITALLLALLMLALPVLGMAATTDEMMEAAKEAGKASRTTVSFIPGDMKSFIGEEYALLYSDILNAVTLTAYDGGDQGALSMSLQGKEVLTAGAAVDGDETFYVTSNLLGGEVVAVKTNEWQPLMERFIDFMVSAEALSAAEAQELKTELAGMFDQMTAAPVDVEALVTKLDWTPAITVITDILARAQSEDVTEQPADSDPAATKITLTMTAEDVVKFYTAITDCLRSDADVMAYLTSQFRNSGIEAGEVLNQIVETIQGATAIMKAVPLTMYLNEAGEVVRVDMPLTMEMEANGAVNTVIMPMAYTRLTIDQGVQHTLTVPVYLGEKLIVDAQGSYLDGGEAGLLTGMMKVNVDDNEYATIKADAVFDDSNLDSSFVMEIVEGSEVISMEGTLVAATTDITTDVAMNLNVTANGETVTLALTINDEQTPGETTASGKGAITGTVTASGVSLALTGEYVTQAQTTAEGVTVDTTCDVGLDILGIEIPLLTVKTVTETVEPEASLVSEAALYPAAMTNEELEAYAAQAMQTAQPVLVELVQNLPERVLKLLMD